MNVPYLLRRGVLLGSDDVPRGRVEGLLLQQQRGPVPQVVGLPQVLQQGRGNRDSGLAPVHKKYYIFSWFLVGLYRLLIWPDIRPISLPDTEYPGENRFYFNKKILINFSAFLPSKFLYFLDYKFSCDVYVYVKMSPSTLF